MNQEGASLIELLAVAAILAIMAGICGPPWLALASRQEAWTVTREIAGELRLGRQLAMSRHTRVRVIIDVNHSVVRTEAADGSGAPLRTYELKGNRIAVESLSNGGHVMFHPNGRSATANTIVLRDRHGNQRTITVGITGKVTVS
ncbi:MAG: GspH/FimT family pseudopilin [Nitrospiraceae bacterium]